MPTIQIANPLGAALGTVSSLAGGYAQGQLAQQRMAAMQQELELRKKREAAYAQALEAEQEDRERTREEANALRSELGAGFRAMNEPLPSEATPAMLQDPNAIADADQQDMVRRWQRGNEIAARVAEKGGNPSVFLDAYNENLQRRVLETARARAYEDLSQDMALGNFAAYGPGGEPVEEGQNPFQGELESALEELGTPGTDPRPALQRIGVIRGKIAQTRTAQIGKQAAAGILGNVLAANPANQAAIEAQAKVESGAWTLDDVQKNLGYISQGLSEFTMPDGKSVWLPAGQIGKSLHQRMFTSELRANQLAEENARLKNAVLRSQEQANLALAEDRMRPDATREKPLSWAQKREMAIQNVRRKAGESLESGTPALTEDQIQEEMRLLNEPTGELPVGAAQTIDPIDESLRQEARRLASAGVRDPQELADRLRMFEQGLRSGPQQAPAEPPAKQSVPSSGMTLEETRKAVQSKNK